MKNEYTIVGDNIYIHIPVLCELRKETMISVTASVQDIDVLSQHRWRYYNDSVITVVGSNVIPLSTVLLESVGGVIPHQKDKNKLNFSRNNLRLGANARQNEILVNRNHAYITLPNAEVAIIDKEDAEKCQLYYWKVYKKRGANIVRTQFKVNKIWRKVDLCRFVLGYEGRKPIKHLNNDYLDCRKHNLQIEE